MHRFPALGLTKFVGIIAFAVACLWSQAGQAQMEEIGLMLAGSRRLAAEAEG